MRRQALNVFRMRLMGATVVPVTSGTRTLKDATNEAIRDWVTNVDDSHYIIGSVVGPAPYPRMVRDFQAVIGREARAQMLERAGRLPKTVVACVGGGSNAMGIFAGFVDDADVELVGVEAAGEGLDTERHSASLTRGTPGVLHGALSYLLQDDARAGASRRTPSPPGSTTRASARSTRTSRTAAARRTSRSPTTRRCAGFALLSRLEGIIPALETSHAVAWVARERGPLGARTSRCCSA